MPLAELLDESLTTEYNDVWERERTATPVRAFAVRLHSAGLSFRETAAILELVDVDRSHQAVWQWKEKLADNAPDPPSAAPTRVAVDETAVKVDGEWQWVYAAIDVETKLLLDITVFSRHGTDPAAAFLHDLTEKNDVEDAEFLVDGYGHSTAPSRVRLSGRLDYSTRNLIETWFHTLKMRTDRFHTSWVGSRAAVKRWLQQFPLYCSIENAVLESDHSVLASFLRLLSTNRRMISRNWRYQNRERRAESCVRLTVE